MKIAIAGVKRAESGTKNGIKHHKISALIESEINDPVMALDSTRPRRIMICAMEKQSAA
jgi:hypothetical protein